MPALIVRPRALLDLAEIWAYIAEDSPGKSKNPDEYLP